MGKRPYDASFWIMKKFAVAAFGGKEKRGKLHNKRGKKSFGYKLQSGEWKKKENCIKKGEKALKCIFLGYKVHKFSRWVGSPFWL